MRGSLINTKAGKTSLPEKAAGGRPGLPPIFRVALCALAIGGLSGCLAKRSFYDVPDIPIAGAFKNSPAEEQTQPTATRKPTPSSVQEDAAFAEWWRFFGNDELEALINRGLANNADVRIATIRLAQAKVRSDQAAAGLLPSVSAPMLIARQAPGGYVGSVPVGSDGRAPQTSMQGSLRGDWRADIWGEQTSLLESAQLQLWRAAYERDNVQRNVTAAIASSYIEFIALNDRLRVSRETERVLSETMRATEQRVAMGDATLGDLEQQRAVIFGLRASIPTMEQQRVDAVNTLAFMVGTVPGALKLSEQGLDSLVLPGIVQGLPSSLLLRRPDVKMAEARLLSADADIDVARTRILPPLDLTTQAGYSANYLAQFFQPQQFFWTAIANLTTSIFDGGRRKGEKKYAEAVYEEMVETYARTIYQAIREVESALATVNLANKRMRAQLEAANAAKRAWDVNVKAFSLGGVDQLTLLDSERNYHRYLDEYQRYRMDHYRGYITLFQALGGGVRPAGAIPGKGRRPGAEDAGPTIRAAVANDIAGKAKPVDGLDWKIGSGISPGAAEIEKFWQIELPGLYHRSTVGAAWRDLRERYPEQMAGRMVRPRLSGKIDDEGEGGQEAWYRLYIAKFDKESEARKFCELMLAGQERCRVVSSHADEKAGEDNVPLPKPPAAGSSGSASAKTVRAEKRDSGAPTTPDKTAQATIPETPASEHEPANLPKATEPTAYTVQLGAFSNLENAAISNASWQSRGYDTYISKTKANDGREWFAVRTGVFAQQREGAAAAQAIRQKEDAPAVIVPTPLDAGGKPEKIEIADVAKLTASAGNEIQPEPPEARPTDQEPPASTAPARKTSSATENKPAFAVQLGAFSNQQNAQMSLEFWRGRKLDPYLAKIGDDNGRLWYAVRTGLFQARREASALALQLGRKEKISALVVAANRENILPVLNPAPVATPTAAPIPTPARASLPKVAEDPVPPPPPKAGESALIDKPRASTEILAAAPKQQAKPAKEDKPRFSVQLGAFATIENATTAYAEWLARGYEAYVCEMTDRIGKLRFAVRVGGFTSRHEGLSRVRAIKHRDGARPVLVSALLDAEGKLAQIDVTPLLNAVATSNKPIIGANARDGR